MADIGGAKQETSQEGQPIVSELPNAFSRFHNKIVLGKAQRKRIDSASETLIDKLKKHYELGDGEVFLQGSYPNGTAIDPDPEKDDGEYDVDLISVSASAVSEPDEAIEEMEDALDAVGYGKYFERDSERPCVRLRYADDPDGTPFHVDVVPARHSSGEAPLEIPRPGSGWHESAPAEFTTWCEDQGELFARTVQMLKRWRDHSQDAKGAIKSIIFQVLIADHVDTGEASDANRVVDTLRGISDYLGAQDQVPCIENPVLPSEDLGKRWDEAEFKDFKEIVSGAADLAEEALNLDGQSKSSEKWIELFGKDFPKYGDGNEGGVTPPPTPAPGVKQQPRQEYPKTDGWG